MDRCLLNNFTDATVFCVPIQKSDTIDALGISEMVATGTIDLSTVLF
jgi:hypothetical protein